MPVPAEAVEETEEKTRQEDRGTAQALVEQLGSEQFHRREAARRELRQLGRNARPALLGGLDSPDVEIRRESHRLLTELVETRIQAEIDRLLYEYCADSTYQLPAWELFRSAAGDRPEARGLYVLMLRSHAKRLRWLEAHLGHGSEVEVASDQLTEFLSPDTDRLRAGDPAYWAAMLMTGAQTRDARLNVLDARLLADLLDESVAGELQSSAYGEPLRGLLEAWLRAFPASQSMRSRVRLCLQYGLADLGRELIREIFGRQPAPASVQSALAGLLRWSPEEAPDALCEALSDRRTCHTWQVIGKQRRMVRTEVRDTALALLLWQAGIDPRHVGFADLQADPLTVYRDYSTGFADDAARLAAFRTARARMDEVRPQWAMRIPLE